LGALGPPPFRFTPEPGPVLRGPAFTPFFKALVTVVVFGCAYWMAQLWMSGRAGEEHRQLMYWFAAGLAMMLWTWWSVVRSVTTVSSEQLHQTWVWDKKMELRELAYAKLIRVPGLDWLIAPRLYVRTLLGKFAVFYAADPAMVRELDRLVRELRAFRTP
jgi:hypothetical protein